MEVTAAMRTTQAPMYSCGGRRAVGALGGQSHSAPPTHLTPFRAGSSSAETLLQQHAHTSSDMREALKAGAPGDNVCTELLLLPHPQPSVQA